MPSKQRAAIVTGSSSGIGKAIAIRLISAGFKTVLNYSADDKRAAETLLECQQVDPDTIMVKADVASADESCRLVAEATGKFGRLDVLVNNAARVADSSVLEMTEDEWDSVLAVNLKGAFLCSQRAARQMITQSGGGTILNIGSSTGLRARRNGANTCASKAGLMIMTQCLALELAPKVRVNTIIPGLVVTSETTGRFKLDDPAVRSAREEAIPLQRLGRPEDVADAVMLMLADEARFVTGQKLVIDGGQNMW
jgi:3-oxoacyl-[acyl-carrier protein] reductase